MELVTRVPFADMFKDATAMVRDHIAAHSDEWQQIISTPTFTENFIVKGTALKKVPGSALYPHYLLNH